MESNLIHPTATIGKEVKIGSGNVIGAYCLIEGNITIGNNNNFLSHVVVRNNVTIGNRNTFYEFSSIGNRSQDKNCTTDINLLSVKIGDDNCFRESVTVHLGTAKDRHTTIIGNKNLLMANSHVAHDCIIKNNVVIANSTALAGHVIVGNNVVIGGGSGIHQKITIGDAVMIGGGSTIKKHILPFSSIIANILDLHKTKLSLNVVGLGRYYNEDESSDVKKIFKNIVFKKGLSYNDKLEMIKNYHFHNDNSKNTFKIFFEEVQDSKFDTYLK